MIQIRWVNRYHREPMRAVGSAPLVATFADRYLEWVLPGLPPSRRQEVVTFVCRRIDAMPSLTRLGALGVAGVFRMLLALPAGESLARHVAEQPIPVLAEYPRLVRSLGWAYVWETWPDTHPDGRAPDVDVAP